MTAMNVEYTCPACGGVQTVSGARAGEALQVPECANPACTAEPQWGAVSLTMLRGAVATVAQTHPNNPDRWTAMFILRLLKQVRPVKDITDPDAAANWQQQLDTLARR